MEIYTRERPEKEIGEHLTKIINEHDGDIFCLLAGGSALDIIEFIQPMYKNECRTIFMMGDERVSGVSTENNYLQLAYRYRDYRILEHVIDTSAQEKESTQAFSQRIQKKISETLSELKNVKVLTVLGIGNDGHTAGIFPMDRTDFLATYPRDQTYVPVVLKSLELNFRASFTPQWILDNSQEIFVYAVGEAKAEMLYTLMTDNKAIHERPAELIKQHVNVHVYTDQKL